MTTANVQAFQYEGARLSWQQWVPDSAKASLLISHGYAEHAGRYAHFAEFLMAQGYAVYALDHRGHGQSEGEKANIASFEQYVQDLLAFRHHLQELGIIEPCFLLGHSMGGLIAAKLALRQADLFKGLILSAAFLENATEVPAILMSLSGVASRFLPSLATTKLDTKLISRDTDVVKAYNDDPLVYTGGTKARLGKEMLTAGPQVLQKAKQFKLPLLLLHGTADQIASPNGSQKLFDTLELSDKTLKTYEGFYHEILNELGKEEVYTDILEWLEQRLTENMTD